MSTIRIDEQGRRYAQRPGGIRIYLPTPGTRIDPDKARRNAEAIERYHRRFADTINPEEDDS